MRRKVARLGSPATMAGVHRALLLAAVLSLALVPAGCGSSGDGGPPPTRSVSASGVAAPARLSAACTGGAASGPADAFPAGLLPAASRVTGPGYALVAHSVRDTLIALKTGARRLGYTVQGEDFEGVEAELELAGADGDLALQLKQAPGCGRFTRVQRTSG